MSAAEITQAHHGLRNNLISVALFQGVWFTTVWGAIIGNHLVGPAALAFAMACHYFVFGTAKADFLLVAISAATGLVIETIYIQAGLIMYANSFPSTYLAPLWVWVLWGNFALIMNGCIKWLQGKPLLAAVLGFLGAPLSYYAGIQLGAATSGPSKTTLLAVIAITYAIVTPLFLNLAHRLALAAERQ